MFISALKAIVVWGLQCLTTRKFNVHVYSISWDHIFFCFTCLKCSWIWPIWCHHVCTTSKCLCSSQNMGLSCFCDSACDPSSNVTVTIYMYVVCCTSHIRMYMALLRPVVTGHVSQVLVWSLCLVVPHTRTLAILIEQSSLADFRRETLLQWNGVLQWSRLE